MSGQRAVLAELVARLDAAEFATVDTIPTLRRHTFFP
jgi:hypothetical protein